MAIEKKYITLSDLDDNQIVSTKLYVDQYNQTELEKAVDVKVTELINALPDVNLDLVPKPVYDSEVSHSKELELNITKLELEITDLTAKVQLLTSDSSSLYISNDNLRVTNAKLENTVASIQETTLELRMSLTTSLTKALNEATERTALEAENNGLNAQKNALIKQIDTLNNLLAQANASLQVAAQQLSAKAQAVGAGGISTGELSTIVFDGGDPTKKKVSGIDICMDYGAGYGSTATAGKFAASGDPFKNNYTTYFDLVAGPKDISLNVTFSGGITNSIFDFGSNMPILIKANETKRLQLDKPAAYINQIAGQGAVPTNWLGIQTGHSSGTTYNYTMRISVQDMDTSGKTESKDFSMRLYNHN